MPFLKNFGSGSLALLTLPLGSNGISVTISNIFGIMKGANFDFNWRLAIAASNTPVSDGMIYATSNWIPLKPFFTDTATLWTPVQIISCDSISVNSMRNPLNLICESIRPRNSISPDPFIRHKSPVRYRRLGKLGFVLNLGTIKFLWVSSGRLI